MKPLLFLNKCRRVNGLSEFQSHPGGLIAFLNDSAHYFQLYSSPLHGALPCPYRVSAPSLLSSLLRPGMCSTNHLSLNAE